MRINLVLFVCVSFIYAEPVGGVVVKDTLSSPLLVAEAYINLDEDSGNGLLINYDKAPDGHTEVTELGVHGS
jgi:hypothetical protein